MAWVPLSLSSKPHLGSLFLFGLTAITLALSFILNFHNAPGLPTLHRKDIVPSHSLLDEQELDLFSNRSLLALAGDDQYTCTKKKPCSTNACCGSFLGTDTGTCGFGPTYCGNDCVSQCDAKPECGQYADPPGKTCPLNVCCSAYGFCGTAEKFCDAKQGCQSNCGSPEPPAGTNKDGVLKKVVGYYEAWSARRKCYAFPPSAIPIEGLTHVNFAFAYIDPKTYEVTTMDSATPEDLFVQTADVRSFKTGNSDLEVFISIGGWTFSDNDTATQPTFGEIASSAENRQKFARNLVTFMQKYGFDGVDLDWEYPGAGDRGGKQRDVDNYVLLMKTLRETFDASERGSYGLTFTIPSSYWYLRWFDLPGLLKYADWVNLMSYDLHGIWDRDNPIGSIVQGHTNLTEIKQAAELLWRNDVKPEQVVLGVGFYGRSFKLEDPSCSKPGCAFSGAADAGPCTDSGGTLAYFEIQDILKDSDVKPVHDKNAAVNYITFNKDQWVSYDTEETFKQKIDWADDIGLGGLMIWSVDQDDDQFSALTGLIGRSPGTFAEITKKTAVSDAGHWASLDGQKCVRTDCAVVPECPAGYELAPFPNPKAFPDDCGDVKSRVICCPVNSMPTSCQWRGGESGRSCHGQCHEGEVTLFHSRHATVSCLKPGFQAACCEASTWSTLIDACEWYSSFSGKSQMFCPAGKNKVAYKYNPRQGLLYAASYTPLCCPEENSFENCHWVGKGGCDDNECSDTDVEVALDAYGEGTSTCRISGRKKVLCCNTPKDLNPFLPVSLDKVFPTLPPASDFPQFDLQNLGADSSPVVNEPNQQTFGMVIIDGPSSSVSSLNKRDGSHLEVLSCEEIAEDRPSIVQVVCMNSGPDSNCRNIEEGGVEGTIVRMPDNCGPGSYAVVHSVMPSLQRDLPAHIKRSAPDGAEMLDVELSYDFSLAKRDAGDIYIRIDYSNSRDYWNKVVQGDPVKKRSLDKRFYSGKADEWKKLFDGIRGDNKGLSSLSKNSFEQLLVGDDGKDKNCSGSDDAFLKMSLSGSITDSMNFGFSFVGTISPTWKIEEAYSFFDSSISYRGSLSFDGSGKLNIPSSMEPRPLFKSAITNYGFSHPGIVSFEPELNINVRLEGTGSIDGKFSVDFVAGNNGQTRYNQPPSLGQAAGSVSNTALSDAFQGDISIPSSPSSELRKRADVDTTLAMYLNMEALMKVNLNTYQSALVSYNGTYRESVDSYLRVKSNGDITFSNDRARYEFVQAGDMPGWKDTDQELPVGNPGSINVLHQGTSEPEDHGPPKDIVGYAVFGDRVMMICKTNSTTRCLSTAAFMKANPQLLIDPDTGVAYDDEDQADTDDGQAVETHELQKRGWGKRRKYKVHVEDGKDFVIISLPYYNGENGQSLLGVNPDAGFYNAEDPEDCTNLVLVADSDDAAARYVTEHVLELQYFGRMLAFAINGWTRDPGQTERIQAQNPRVAARWLDADSLFFKDYSTWDTADGSDPARTGTPVNRVWEAFGSRANPQRQVNLEESLNSIKELIFSGSSPMTDDTWRSRGYDRLDFESTQEAISYLTRAIHAFEYLNHPAINTIFAEGIEIMNDEFEYYSQRIAANFPEDPDLPTHLAAHNTDYLWRAVIPRIENMPDTWLRMRLSRLTEMWTTARDQGNTLGNPNQVNAIIATLAQLTEKAESPDMILHTERFPTPPHEDPGDAE